MATIAIGITLGLMAVYAAKQAQAKPKAKRVPIRVKKDSVK
jgi:hypothetical protein